MINFLGELLRVGQLINHGFILQHIIDILDFTQRLQDRIFNLQKFFLVRSIAFHDFAFLELQLGVLDGHNLSKHLLLKSGRRDGKIDNRHLHRRFRRVDRVRNRCREENLELFIVVQSLIAEGDRGSAPCTLDILLEDRLQGRIEVQADILKEHPLSELNGLLAHADHVRIGSLADF